MTRIETVSAPSRRTPTARASALRRAGPYLDAALEKPAPQNSIHDFLRRLPVRPPCLAGPSHACLARDHERLVGRERVDVLTGRIRVVEAAPIDASLMQGRAVISARREMLQRAQEGAHGSWSARAAREPLGTDDLESLLRRFSLDVYDLVLSWVMSPCRSAHIDAAGCGDPRSPSRAQLLGPDVQREVDGLRVTSPDRVHRARHPGRARRGGRREEPLESTGRGFEPLAARIWLRSVKLHGEAAMGRLRWTPHPRATTSARNFVRGLDRVEGARHSRLRPRHPPAMRPLLALASLAALACGALRTPRAPEPPLHPSYRPTLAALQDMLERDELALAERTLQQWRARLGMDAALAARASDTAALAPGRPDAAAVAAAERALERYELTVAGRRVFAGLDIALTLRRVAGEPRVRVELSVASRLDEAVELRPGPATLEVRRQTLEPRTGQETHTVELLPAAEALRIAVPARGTTLVALGDVPVVVPTGAIATRTRCKAVLLGGAVLAGGRELPARPLEVPEAERTDLPGWLPSTAVEPAELARLAAQPGATMEALCERAVRVLPARRTEALELLREPVALRTVEELVVLMPALRWLCAVEGLGRDPYAWRRYMADAPWRAAAAPGT